jgi:hypothetical protein
VADDHAGPSDGLTAVVDSNGCLQQRAVEVIECLPLGLQIDVAVDVHGHLQNTVTDNLHHRARADPLGQQQGNARVPQVMQGGRPDPDVRQTLVRRRDRLRGSSGVPTVVPKT